MSAFSSVAAADPIGNVIAAGGVPSAGGGRSRVRSRVEFTAESSSSSPLLLDSKNLHARSWQLSDQNIAARTLQPVTRGALYPLYSSETDPLTLTQDLIREADDERLRLNNLHIPESHVRAGLLSVFEVSLLRAQHFGDLALDYYHMGVEYVRSVGLLGAFPDTPQSADLSKLPDPTSFMPSPSVSWSPLLRPAARGASGKKLQQQRHHKRASLLAQLRTELDKEEAAHDALDELDDDVLEREVSVLPKDSSREIMYQLESLDESS